jgi:eukaryotic-like serine/threonine-protein kinase
MKLSELLDIAIQVSSALAAAHEGGIVHRDIKPENIMLRRDGYVKVLDFGLAKLIAPRLASVATQTVAESTLKTASGILMGTAHYMSPEQVRGEELDARSDLFSFGVLVYEMATGRQPFSGNTSGMIFDCILNRTPTPPLQLNPDLPPKLEEIISKALEKEREVRYHSARDLLVDLKRLKRDTDSGRAATASTPSPPLPAKQPRPQWHRRTLALAGTVALLAGLLALLYLRQPLPPPKVLRYVPLTSDGRQKFRLVTDGSRLYFSTFLGTGAGLAQVSCGGGETVLTTSPFQNTIPLDISPNGSELLVRGFTGLSTDLTPLWVLPVLGGSPRRLGDVRAADATWMPDGQQLVYAQGSDLYLAKGDGTESRKLVTAPGPPRFLRWSADGTRLRFTVGDDFWAPQRALWEVAADGTNLHPLLPGWNNPPDECCGSWTPDGKYYLFSSGQGGVANLWALREQPESFSRSSRQPVQLTAGPLSFSFAVASRDGKRLFAVGAQPRGELMRYDGRSGQFLPYLAGLSAEHLDFSRDGKWVAYITYPEATLWRSKVDGSQRQQLSSPPLRAVLPRWSPDGKQIVFYATAPGQPFKLYLVSSEGGTPRKLLPGERIEVDPSWSVDGHSIVFGRLPGFDPSGAVALHRLDLATGQLSTLPGSEGLISSLCSPDGRYISAVPKASDKLLLFDVTAQKWVELAQMPINYMYWSRDSKYVYFDSISRTDPAIFRVGVNDRKVERVVSLKDFRRVYGTWGPWFALAPDDSPVLLRDIGTAEIYALDWEAP